VVGPCGRGNEQLWFHKMWGISLLTIRLSGITLLHGVACLVTNCSQGSECSKAICFMVFILLFVLWYYTRVIVFVLWYDRTSVLFTVRAFALSGNLIASNSTDLDICMFSY
jgi:hypothetical protein